MPRKVLTVIVFLIFTLGLTAVPAQIAKAQPTIKISPAPAGRCCEYRSAVRIKPQAGCNPAMEVTERSFPRVIFPSGASICIPRYVDDAGAGTAAGDAKRTPALEPAPAKEPNDENGKTDKIIKPILPDQKVAIPRQADVTPADTRSDPAAVNLFRAGYDDSPAHALVGRAIWYMKYGYMVYGHKKYWDTGYIDCSNFVSLVYKDFGYKISSAARKYNSVGRPVKGVYVKRQPGSKKKYTLAGTDKLKPGDIFTFWKEDSRGNRYIGHVALYMGKFKGKPTVIHTVKGRPTAIGITNSFTYWYGEHFNGVRRVFDSSAYVPGASYTDKGPVIPARYQMKPGRVIMPASLPQGF